ncbi:probable serine/threonine-protein kinase kinX [Betta splendens]|uniref:Probable serine/threonine-protein kinase kinX n=1 Tax=Betta splendens TaxID=158456 RepID=A0A6P7PWG8_BETSP|nr:probable serine/threonine-protein kinase kinX [Betta splendens]XP_029030434.1 probable serine/threonine-protein kinase kinX [Betta splendens]XP_040929788.1 probable serine/threonine-protein kinase kinX [Betta splendens]
MEAKEFFRKYLWLLIILGMIFVTVVISIIFILINKCLSKKGKHRIAQLQKRTVSPVESNKYQETNLWNTLTPGTPPLPPRTQFLTAAAQSYENLAETPGFQPTSDSEEDKHDYEEAEPQYEQDLSNYEQPVPDDEQDKHDYEEAEAEYEQNRDSYVQPTLDSEDRRDYEEAEAEYEQDLSNYEQPVPDHEQDKHDYEEAEADYEEVTEEQPDYVKMEPNEEVFPPPPPPPQNMDPAEDDDYEDYDDVGGEDEDQEEDYDDVG